MGSDGNAYEPKGSLPTGVTAVAIISYVGISGDAEVGTSGYRGLAFALSDVSNYGWDSGCSHGE